jgi:hypothetical protein
MFGFGKPDQEELNSLAQSCKLVLTAYNACLKANELDKKQCQNLEHLLIDCAAKKTCPAQHKEYVKCIEVSHRNATQEGRLRIYKTSEACQTELELMKKCLRRIRLWPALLNVTL